MLTWWAVRILLLSVVHASGSVRKLCFAVVGDFGGSATPPYTTKQQINVARMMEQSALSGDVHFVVGVGDNFYWKGVSSVDDMRFEQTFERVYSNSPIMSEMHWYMCAGNHDHYGNVSAQIAYSKKSKRWLFPDYYYSHAHNIPGTNTTVEFMMIDTMLICGNDKQAEKQVNWLTERLQSSKADYVFVAGHHPVWSIGKHGNTACLVDLVLPLFEKYGVTAYLSGHDHNLQHISSTSSSVEFMVSGSGAKINGEHHKDKKMGGTLKFFNGKDEGFISICCNDAEAVASFKTKHGVAYTTTLKPRVTHEPNFIFLNYIQLLVSFFKSQLNSFKIM